MCYIQYSHSTSYGLVACPTDQDNNNAPNVKGTSRSTSMSGQVTSPQGTPPGGCTCDYLSDWPEWPHDQSLVQHPQSTLTVKPGTQHPRQISIQVLHVRKGMFSRGAAWHSAKEWLLPIWIISTHPTVFLHALPD